MGSDRGERRFNENKSSTTVYVDSNMSILLQTAIALSFCGEYAHPIRQGQLEKLLIRTRKGETEFTFQEKREATYQDVWTRE